MPPPPPQPIGHYAGLSFEAIVEQSITGIYVLQDDPAQGPVLPDLPSCGVACNPQDWARCRVLEVSPLMRGWSSRMSATYCCLNKVCW